MLENPETKKQGRGESEGDEFDEIPGAFYSGADSQSEFITIPNPVGGEYVLKIIGRESGFYKILLQIANDDYPPIKKYIAGYINKGDEENVVFQIEGDKVTRNIGFEKLISDLEMGRDAEYTFRNP